MLESQLLLILFSGFMLSVEFGIEYNWLLVDLTLFPFHGTKHRLAKLQAVLKERHIACILT